MPPEKAQMHNAMNKSLSDAEKIDVRFWFAPARCSARRAQYRVDYNAPVSAAKNRILAASACHSSLLFASLLVASALAQPAYAETNNAETNNAETRNGLDNLLMLSMEELLSLKIKISTHSDQTLSRAPSVVSVITEADIKATGATNLRDILQSVPGIYVRANLFGFRPQITFRGAAPTQTLLMVDGTPMRDLVWNSGIFWRGLPTSMIDRIEIIRGPGSALFGSDASAGVINIITKVAQHIEGSEVGLRAGSFNTQSAWIQHGAYWNGFDINFTAELARTDGHRPYIAKDGQTQADQDFGTSISHAPNHARYGWDNADFRVAIAKENWRLIADYGGHKNIEIGLTGAGVLDPHTEGDASRTNVGLFYHNETFSHGWGLHAELRFHLINYSSGDGFQERPAGYTDATGTYPAGQINQMRASERGFNFEASGLYTGIRGHAIRVGGGHHIKDLYSVDQFTNFGTGPDGIQLPAASPLVDLSNTAYAFTPQKTRQVTHLFVQDIWTLSPELELTAGARYDHYSDFGGTFNPRLAWVWQSTDRLTTKLMYGQAFRAPSYLELYAPTAATKPNPKLTPEESTTWDLSMTYLTSKDLKLGLTLYQFEQSDLIAEDANTMYQNIGNRTSHGLELEAQWQASKSLRISGNLSQIRENDSTFPRSLPKQKAYLRTDWSFQPAWNLNFQANWIGERKRAAHDIYRAPLNAYTLVDTTLRYSPRSNWAFSASVRNLFDADAREYSSTSLAENLPLPERNIYLEMTYRF
jgi:outer membrane receptor protein involved in Fe transport